MPHHQQGPSMGLKLLPSAEIYQELRLVSQWQNFFFCQTCIKLILKVFTQAMRRYLKFNSDW